MIKVILFVCPFVWMAGWLYVFPRIFYDCFDITYLCIFSQGKQCITTFHKITHKKKEINNTSTIYILTGVAKAIVSTCLSPYCLGLFIPLSVFLLFFISSFFCVLVCLCWLCYILSCFFFNFFIFIMFSCHWEVVTAVVHAFVIALTSTCVLTRLKNAIRHHYPVKLFVCMSVRLSACEWARIYAIY